jgi:hypothetical protein
VGFRVASPLGVVDGLHMVSSAGVNLSGAVNVPGTGGSQEWATVTATVTLPAGRQTLTVDQDNGGWDIASMTFTATKHAPTHAPDLAPTTAPTSAPTASPSSLPFSGLSAPSNLVASSTTSSGTTLSWGASTGGSGTITYDIDRNDIQVASTTGTSVTDTGLRPSSTYGYTVIATDTGGDISAASSAVLVTTMASSGVNPSTWYQVININSGDCVDDTNGVTSNGTAVQQWACTAGDINQEWQFQPTSDGYYQVATDNDPGEVWDVTGGPSATSDGTPIQLWSATGGTNQQWLPTLQSNGTYTFTARNSGNECLDVTNRSTSNGTQLQQWACTAGDTAQTFQLVPES